MKTTRFIIIGNSRTGTTWLTTALNEIPDITTDYEVKIPPINYQKLPNHFILCPNFKENFYPKLPHTKVVGTKLVLDPKPHDESQFEYIRSCLDEEIKVIFLKRCLAEQTISQMKHGMVNILNTQKKHKKNNINARLQLESQRVAKIGDRTITLNEESINFFMKSILIRLANDLLIHKYLTEINHQFIVVDYSEIPEKFTTILRFINSAEGQFSDISDYAVTEKVNKEQSSIEIFLKAFAKEFNILRDQMLTSSSASFETIKLFYRT